MRKWFGFALLTIALTALVIAGSHIYHQRVVDRQLRVAYKAVQTVVDYQESASFGSADLAARTRIDELESESLDPAEEDATQKLAAYLAAVESLASSRTLETATMREGIARAALKEADDAMVRFK